MTCGSPARRTGVTEESGGHPKLPIGFEERGLAELPPVPMRLDVARPLGPHGRRVTLVDEEGVGQHAAIRRVDSDKEEALTASVQSVVDGYWILLPL